MVEETDINNPFKVFDKEIEKILERMLELANESKEPLGTRLPGEKCMYEIQRAERAKSLPNVDE